MELVKGGQLVKGGSEIVGLIMNHGLSVVNALSLYHHILSNHLVSDSPLKLTYLPHPRNE